MSEVSIPEQMNLIVNEVVGQDTIDGFKKAYLVAESIGKLSQLLNAEYMKPIMNLQGKRLGFKTDKNYSEAIVKDCLIEAVFMGLQPCGNEFNIIAGNCYPTKEGMGALLLKISGLKYTIVPDLPRVKEKSAAIIMKIKWSIDGSVFQTQDLDIPIRVNSMMGTDAIIGKATRKARAWLYGEITGSEIGDGDVTDVDFKIVGSKKSESEIVENRNLQLVVIKELYKNNVFDFTEPEKEHVERIIDTEEVLSYDKVQNLLIEKLI